MEKNSFIILLLCFSLIVVGVVGFIFFNNLSPSFTGHAVAGTCSGTPPCIYPNENSCNNHEGCSWSDGSCIGSCSGFSDESSCISVEGCTWTEEEESSISTTTSGGGGTTIQKVIGISPKFPLGGDTIYQAENQLEVKIYYAGEPTNYAKVKANSSMFGLIELKHFFSDPEGIYKANVTIDEDVSLGSNRIFYEVTYSNQFNEFSMLVDVKSGLNIDAQLNERYYKGGRMIFSGKVFDLNNSVVPNSSVTIKGFYQGIMDFSLDSLTNESGGFYIEKIISHGQIAGTWEIKLSAKSPDGKIGTKTLTTEIDFPEGVSYYNVNFLSPLKDKTYRRGDTIPVSIEVKDTSKNLIENAEVVIYTTKNEKISLEETQEKGVYSGNYIIEKDSELRKWFLKSEVSKTEGSFTKFGGASIPITIGSTEINFNLKSPDNDLVFTNSRLKIKTELTYSDGSLVKGAKPRAILSNGEIIELAEKKDGFYEGDYFINVDDAGTLKVKIEAEDINGNLGVLEKSFVVRKRSFIGNVFGSLYDVLSRYLWAVLIFVLFLGYMCKPFTETKILLWKINKLKKDANNIKIAQKDIEKKYYEQGAISKKEFDNLESSYETKLENKEEKVKELRNILSDKMDYFKRTKRR